MTFFNPRYLNQEDTLVIGDRQIAGAEKILFEGNPRIEVDAGIGSSMHSTKKTSSPGKITFSVKKGHPTNKYLDELMTKTIGNILTATHTICAEIDEVRKDIPANTVIGASLDSPGTMTVASDSTDAPMVDWIIVGRHVKI